eukprot:TRINITY_DN4973_c0_g1_i1.p1 TRINITY_DN4973_c0_g1~~TRINITY_DN4973_c0_g1_i1.p1  ORF type:complete len:818 (-),score=253.42 TRINITY_DN4973_c0_g1_i1:19-2472(-)
MERRRIYPQHPATQASSNSLQPVTPNPLQPTPTPTTQPIAPTTFSTAPATIPGAFIPRPESTAQPNVQQVSQPIIYTPKEEYQCPKELMRMTINCAPQTSQLAQKAAIPFGAVIHPLNASAAPIPLVDFGNIGVIRCKRCRAYINPYIIFQDAGRRYKCNLCGASNEIPHEYYAPLNDAGQRTDLQNRPELCYGAVEFVASAEYMVRPPQPPLYFFVIDVSLYAVSSGQLQLTADTILKTLDSLPGDGRAKIGFLTFDSKIHYYNFRQNSTRPQMMVVNNLEEVLVPAGYDLLVDLKDCRKSITTFLTNLPKMFGDTQEVRTCLGSAMKAAFNVQKNIGGKMLVFSSVLPSLGLGKLEARFDQKLLGTDKEINLLKPQTEWFKKFAVNCSKQQICVDIFIFARDSQYSDVATLATVPEISGGQLYYYPNFNGQNYQDASKYTADIWTNLTRETGFEAVMRVRASNGMKISAHYGNFFIRSTDLLALPTIDPTKAFGVQLQVTEDLGQITNIVGPFATLQAALLYTTSNQERRIRVMTISLPIANDLTNIFNLADANATVNLMTKMAIQKSLTTKLTEAREAIVNKCVDILSVYRQSFGTPNTNVQLMLPESLKALPLYVLAVVKSVIFKTSTTVNPDVRSYFTNMFRVMGTELGAVFLYPRLFALHNMPEECGVPDETTGAVVLPAPVNLSSEKIERNGIFLLDNGHQFLLWIAKAVDPQLLLDLTGTDNFNELDVSRLAIDSDPNQPVNTLKNRIVSVINSLRVGRANYQSVHIIKEGSGGDIYFFSHFIEDRTNTVYSYYEFLVQLQRTVSTKSS